MLKSVAAAVFAVRSTATGLAWVPLVQTTRSLCLAILGQTTVGTLKIVDCDGKVHICGSQDHSSHPQVTLTVQKDAFWVRLAFYADMGFAESYLLSEVTCSDLVSFFKLMILNRASVSTGTITSALASSVTGFLRATNSLNNAQLNIAAHYDISNGMFAGFLSADMTYSCPIWLPKSDQRSEGETLEDAQDRKLARFIENARLKSSDRVLEIGTGWGSFAIKAVRETGCSIVSLTLSKEQKQLAEDNIRDAGLSHKITVLLCDYRALEIPAEGRFDKVVSIEMLEAVGREFLNTYFECVDRLLKPEGGIAVFQCITIPDARYDSYSKGNDFIRQYIFPGGHLPSNSQLVASIAAGSKGLLIVDSIENIGAHYAKTLRVWRTNFLNNFDTQIKPALLREHEDMTKSDIEVFRRKWEYYFTYCEAGFATKTLGDIIITAGREGAMEMIEDVPL